MGVDHEADTGEPMLDRQVAEYSNVSLEALEVHPFRDEESLHVPERDRGTGDREITIDDQAGLRAQLGDVSCV